MNDGSARATELCLLASSSILTIPSAYLLSLLMACRWVGDQLIRLSTLLLGPDSPSDLQAC